MANNFLQEGDTLSLIAPSGGVTSGVGYMIGGLFVVALTSAAQGAVFSGMTGGVFSMTKNTHATTKAFTAGETVFWDDTNKRWDKTATGLFGVGIAVEAATSTGTSVKVLVGRTGVAAA